MKEKKAPIILTTGQTIRVIRMQQGIKQYEVERKVELAQGRLSRIEVADEDLKVSTLIKICEALKTSPAEFFQIKRGI